MAEKDEVGTLSASKITTWFGCNLAFYLKYILHSEVTENVRLSFGKAIHYILNRFYEVNYKSDESFVKFWKFYWYSVVAGDFLKGKKKEKLQTEEYELKNGFKFKLGNHINFGEDPVGVFFGYKRLGESILKKFYNRHKNLPPPIMREERHTIDINGHKVIVIFDRVDEYKGETYLTDYKTDKSCPDKESFVLHRHPQFTLCSLAFRKIFGRQEDAILYYHLRKSKLLETHRGEKDYDYIKMILDEAAEGICSKKYVPFYGFHCNMCDYKVPCEICSVSHDGPKLNLEGKIIPAKEFLGWNVSLNDKERELWFDIAEER